MQGTVVKDNTALNDLKPKASLDYGFSLAENHHDRSVCILLAVRRVPQGNFTQVRAVILRSQDLTSPHGGSTWKLPRELPASRVIEVLTQVGVDKHRFVNPNKISDSSP
ncbi:MAG: hypothetical protein DWI00_03710 [Planctomycetota bacterium]|nr:MAG: hypothetical protein DWI00_03710 [Planctomycetota bacterium]